jgi:hypothetical protein
MIWPLIRGCTTAMFAVTLLAGCDAHPTAFSDEGLRMELVVSRTELVVPRDSVLVRVIATNTTRWPRTIPVMGCDVNFRLFDATGAHVSTPGRCLYRIDHVLLRPGERFEQAVAWGGETVTIGAARTPTYVAPGTYELRGLIHGSDLFTDRIRLVVRSAGD